MGGVTHEVGGAIVLVGRALGGRDVGRIRPVDVEGGTEDVEGRLVDEVGGTLDELCETLDVSGVLGIVEFIIGVVELFVDLFHVLMLIVEFLEVSLEVDPGGQLKRVCTGTTSTYVEGIVIGISYPALLRASVSGQNKGTQRWSRNHHHTHTTHSSKLRLTWLQQR